MPQSRRKDSHQAVLLRLRPVTREDEVAVRAATRDLAGDDFVFAWGLDQARSFDAFVASVAARRDAKYVAGGLVPETYLLAEVDGVIVGRLSLRHSLNESLQSSGGHIGFGVLREHRRRGYATEILRQALALARGLGLERVLLTCSESNVGSRGVIESLGGVYSESVPALAGQPENRLYWIALF